MCVRTRFNFVFFSEMKSAAKSVPVKTGHKKDKYDIDTYTFCMLATDKEDENRYKVFTFNPCSKHEETIADRLSHQHDCAMVSLEGMVLYSRSYSTITYNVTYYYYKL